MATRFYVSTDFSVAPPISPTASATWDDSTGLDRYFAVTSPTAEAWPFGGTAGDYSAWADRDFCAAQFITAPLKSGQVITAQTMSAQFRAVMTGGGTVYLMLGARILAANGTTVRRTLTSPARDNTAIDGAGSNRSFSKAMSFSNYTIQSGDRLVFEIGAGGYFPGSAAAVIDCGSQTGTDLPVDDSTTTLDRPWIELTQTLEFEEEWFVGTGSYALTGQSADLAAEYLLDAGTGTYVLNGQDVQFVESGGVGDSESPGTSATGGFMMILDDDLL